LANAVTRYWSADFLTPQLKPEEIAAMKSPEKPAAHKAELTPDKRIITRLQAERLGAGRG